MTILDSILPRFAQKKARVFINPDFDREVRRWIKWFSLWRVLHGRAVAGVFFDSDSTILHLKVTTNGHDFYALRVDPRTLNFIVGPVEPGEIWLKLHYRWLRVDRISWESGMLSIQCTGDWTTFLICRRSKKGYWHLLLPH